MSPDPTQKPETVEEAACAQNEDINEAETESTEITTPETVECMEIRDDEGIEIGKTAEEKDDPTRKNRLKGTAIGNLEDFAQESVEKVTNGRILDDRKESCKDFLRNEISDEVDGYKVGEVNTV